MKPKTFELFITMLFVVTGGITGLVLGKIILNLLGVDL